MTIRQVGALHDGGAEAQIADRPKKAHHEERQRDDSEVVWCEYTREDDADSELSGRTDGCPQKPPFDCSCRAIRQGCSQSHQGFNFFAIAAAA
jgi:hypothetical protein